MQKVVKITTADGHAMMSANFAKLYNLPVGVYSNKTDKAAYEAETERIFRKMCFCSDFIFRVPFEERQKFYTPLDFAEMLKAGTLGPEDWDKFAQIQLKAEFKAGLLEYEFLASNYGNNVLIVPQKLRSAEHFGVSAQDQSVTLEAFNWLDNYDLLPILGLHYDQEKDQAVVEKIMKSFGLYVPGSEPKTEKVAGLRNADLSDLYHLFGNVNLAVGVPGLHTWYMLTMFPNIPQIILYRQGIERWDEIAAAYQKRGYDIYAFPFDEHQDMKKLSDEIDYLVGQIAL